MGNPSKVSSTAEEFGEKLLDVINHAGLALMISLGHRTGLFDSMAGRPPATSQQIADHAGLNERYVREWLGAMFTGGIVEHDPQNMTYALPALHAGFLTRAASPNNLAASMQWVAVLGYVEEEVFQAFRHGRGVPYSAYRRFHEVMAEESAQSVVAALEDHILPLAPELIERLERGIDVLDVGCGSGRAMISLAQAFPNSRFVGWDLSEEGIAVASSEVNRKGLANAQFAVVDVAETDTTQKFDLITAFDAIHDQTKPDQVLANVAGHLRPGGIFLMQDIAGSGHVHLDADHPVGPFLYTISCMHCMSVSLAGGGPGLGAMWGKRLALEMLKAAGFEDIRIESLPHDLMNYYYIARLAPSENQA